MFKVLTLKKLISILPPTLPLLLILISVSYSYAQVNYLAGFDKKKVHINLPPVRKVEEALRALFG